MTASSHRLWYPRPAREWLEALPVGNGRLGAMVYGGTASEELQLNEDTVWAGGPHVFDNPRALKALPEIRRLVFAGEWDAAQRLVDDDFMGVPVKQPQYQPVGSLRLSFDSAGGSTEVDDYRRELDLTTAVHSVEFTRAGVRHRREVFASAADQVIVVRLTADTPGAITFTATLDSPLGTGVSSPDDATVALTGRGEDANGVAGRVRFTALVRAAAEGGKAASCDGRLRVTDADAVTLLISAGTNYVNWQDLSADPRARADRDLAGAAARPYAELRGRHVADYEALFGRADLEIPATAAAALPTDERVAGFAAGDDPQLAALYFQFGRYLLISSSRPGCQPANLQGLWNDLTDPPWGCKFTININTEMNYWPAAPANLLDCWEPLFALLRDLLVAGARTARDSYGARGWVAHHNTDAWRGTAPTDGAFWGMWPTGGAWLAMSVWEHYRFTGDVAALREHYPVLAGAARFFLDTLVPDPDSGHLVTCPSVSPENAHHPGDGGTLCAGPTMDGQILRDLFGAVCGAAQVLDVDPRLRAEAAAAAKRLPPMRVGAQGQLQEWQQDWDAGAPEQNHRHISHLYGLHPSNQITQDTPELFEAARVTLEQRGDAGTGWSLGWKINFWARLAEGDRSFKLLSDQLTPERTAPNLFDLHPPFQIDGNFGATAGITEWLLQSHTDELRLLPALPGALPAGRVRGLLGRGGFEVALEWSGGALTEARLSSRLGRPARIRTAADVTVAGEGGTPVEVTRPAPGVAEFATRAGESYVIRPRA
ncbi:glycoside hydrolase family 95 protein [Streptomyces litchfieldiae]|uniref:Glycoside hydrolase family 95 protein n=1 Tax=Streptomyces litchfieldiae TaxID=3075543 RepID=A0ABU2MZP7_9ACTN|nr:glycoside hydrolase family 95 protein [Streptomyces sp. DSM 44938]MDT0347100.1 glycoside hydrolase family 95 protein [Streptomyces sp. DSM 44938]